MKNLQNTCGINLDGESENWVWEADVTKTLQPDPEGYRVWNGFNEKKYFLKADNKIHKFLNSKKNLIVLQEGF